MCQRFTIFQNTFCNKDMTFNSFSEFSFTAFINLKRFPQNGNLSFRNRNKTKSQKTKSDEYDA